jgi:[ribosomal protein S5]-alanine N-acetyltransferase
MSTESSTINLPTLMGPHCALRPLRPSDAASLQRHADNPKVAFNLFEGFPQPYTLAMAQDWCSYQHLEPAFAHVLGVVVEHDEVAGCISVTPEQGVFGASAVVGYWLGEAYWGRSVMSEALGLISAWAWGALPQITRLWMPIYARNLRSQAVAHRAGYSMEAHLRLAVRHHGQAIDAVQFGLTRPGVSSEEVRLPPAIVST